MTSQPQRTVLQLIQKAIARGERQREQERTFLLLEDLVDDPIEWSLSEEAELGQAYGGKHLVH